LAQRAQVVAAAMRGADVRQERGYEKEAQGAAE
jgi:hypothetical protein